MSSHNTAWHPNDAEMDMPHQGPYPFNDFASYHFGTSHNQALQSSDDGSRLSPFDLPGSCAVAQYPMDFFEELQEVEEPSPNTGLKLGYRRASTACKQCRHRKIRCVASTSDPRGRCSNCVRLKKDCSSYLTSQPSEDGADTKRVARVSPTPDENLKGIDLSDPCLNMLGLSEDPNSPFSQSTMWTSMSGARIPWTDSFTSGSVASGQSRLNMGSQSIPAWDGLNMRQTLDANIEDFGFGLEIQPPAGLASQFPVYPPVSGSPNAFSQGDAGFPWDSNIYSQPMRSMRGSSEQTNAANMMNGGEGAGFDVHASISTNQLFPPTVNFTLQGRSQSLPYTGYTSNGCMDQSSTRLNSR